MILIKIYFFRVVITYGHRNCSLEKEIKVKEASLEKLHEDLITLQSQLEVANDTINQQKQITMVNFFDRLLCF